MRPWIWFQEKTGAGENRGQPSIVECRKLFFQRNLSRPGVDSQGSRMPSRCDFVNSFRVVTSDWHPRLLHDVALRLKGRRGLDGIDGAKANTRSVSSRVRARFEHEHEHEHEHESRASSCFRARRHRQTWGISPRVNSAPKVAAPVPNITGRRKRIIRRLVTAESLVAMIQLVDQSGQRRETGASHLSWITLKLIFSGENRGQPSIVECRKLFFQRNLSRPGVDSQGSRMPSRCDSVNSFRVVTSDWHPRLLHAVASRLKGGRGLDGQHERSFRVRARIAGTELLPHATASANVGELVLKSIRPQRWLRPFGTSLDVANESSGGYMLVTRQSLVSMIQLVDQPGQRRKTGASHLSWITLKLIFSEKLEPTGASI